MVGIKVGSLHMCNQIEIVLAKKLMDEDSHNNYFQNYYDDEHNVLYLGTVNESGILPYEGLIKLYPNTTDIEFSPLWKKVGIERLSEELKIPRSYYDIYDYGVGVDEKAIYRVDNITGGVMRFIGEYKNIETLQIIRNRVFKNVMEEIGKMEMVKELVFISNRFVDDSHYMNAFRSITE